MSPSQAGWSDSDRMFGSACDLILSDQKLKIGSKIVEIGIFHHSFSPYILRGIAALYTLFAATWLRNFSENVPVKPISIHHGTLKTKARRRGKMTHLENLYV